jgi:hypothetical protein
MREDLISPHPVFLPFPLGNGVRVSSTKLSIAEELFQNQQTACTFLWSQSDFRCLFYKIINTINRIMQVLGF